MEKDCIVIVKCRWTESQYAYPKLLTYKAAEVMKLKLTDVNNEASIKKVVYSS